MRSERKIVRTGGYSPLVLHDAGVLLMWLWASQGNMTLLRLIMKIGELVHGVHENM